MDPCPETFLARMGGGGATSAQAEIWATAHRLYTILTTCPLADAAMRLRAFRSFVRLAMHQRALLLAPFHDVISMEPAQETCPACRRTARLARKDKAKPAATCCWYRPDKRGINVLADLRRLSQLRTMGVDIAGLVEHFSLAELCGDHMADTALARLYFSFEVAV